MVSRAGRYALMLPVLLCCAVLWLAADGSCSTLFVVIMAGRYALIHPVLLCCALMSCWLVLLDFTYGVKGWEVCAYIPCPALLCYGELLAGLH